MPPLRLEASMRLPLNELFETVQGEGSKTGTPSTFVRLQGCDVGCPWCDTKHTWTLEDECRLEVVLGKTGSDTRFAWVSAGWVAAGATTGIGRGVPPRGRARRIMRRATLRPELFEALAGRMRGLAGQHLTWR